MRLPHCHFNPPTPWGVGQYRHGGEKPSAPFQSTHPVGGGTQDGLIAKEAALFQSTHPVGGGTRMFRFLTADEIISIHPPRGGWDRHFGRTHGPNGYFNPPTPWGVGLGLFCIGLALGTFQSTHPVGGGTPFQDRFIRIRYISIHPPRGGWDFHIHQQS